MTKYVCAFALIFSGFIIDFGEHIGLITDVQWYSSYNYFADTQFIGFALLAFLCCPYDRTELKVTSFFFVLWRILVFIINITDISSIFSWRMIYATMALYLAWPLKAWLMGKYKHSKAKPGMYKIFFPIHSIWGLLQAVFLPWHPARYESRMISDGNHVWCVNKKEFAKYKAEAIKNLDHVKVYMGREMTGEEHALLDGMVGTNAIPGIRDCRKLMIV